MIIFLPLVSYPEPIVFSKTITPMGFVIDRSPTLGYSLPLPVYNCYHNWTIMPLHTVHSYTFLNVHSCFPTPEWRYLIIFCKYILLLHFSPAETLSKTQTSVIWRMNLAFIPGIWVKFLSRLWSCSGMHRSFSQKLCYMSPFLANKRSMEIGCINKEDMMHGKEKVACTISWIASENAK